MQSIHSFHSEQHIDRRRYSFNANLWNYKISVTCTYGRREDGVNEFISELFLYLQLSIGLLELIVHHLQLLREFVLRAELFGQQYQVPGRVVDGDVGQVEPALVQILQAPDTRRAQEQDLVRLRDVAHLSLEAHTFTMRAVAVLA